MAEFTTDEIIRLKTVAAANKLEEDIQAIIDIANTEISAKYAEIKAIEDQRDADIQSLREAK